MSAPFLWIILPLLIGGFALLLLDQRVVALTGGFACIALALTALIVPIDEALRLGPISIKIASSASLLGRSLVVPAAEAPFLAVLFGMCALWFFGAESAGAAHRLVPLGLAILALLVASIAVQPFLYASLLIETAVLAAVPLLTSPNRRPGRGVLRFLIYQTLGMPFILLAGWLLAGVEASPGDLSLTVQATVMLGLGFTLLLAIFPLSTWMPQLMEESEPYVAGFLLWLIPNIIVFFGLSFLDRYAWLRTSPEVRLGLRSIGLMMVLVGGTWCVFEKNLARLMAHAVIAETGFLVLAMSLVVSANADFVSAFLIPRGIGLAVWSLSLSVLQSAGVPMDIGAVRGVARQFPWAATGLVLPLLSTAGLPLLAGFPPRIAVWSGLAAESRSAAILCFIGMLVLTIGAIRQVAALIVRGDMSEDAAGESDVQRGMLGIGFIGLLLLGLAPQAVSFVVMRLPLMFQHLGR